MRIAIVNTLYPPHLVGGAERSVALLAAGLAQAGHAVHAIALHPGAEVLGEEIDGVTVHRLPHGRAYWPFDGQRHGALATARWHWSERGAGPMQGTLAALLRKIAPDVVHTNNLTGFGSHVVPLARALDRPVVHTLRDFSLVCARTALFRKGRDCRRRCADCRLLSAPRIAAARGIDLVVGNSAFMVARHRALGLFGDVPAATIYSAVPPPAASHRPVRASGPLRFGFAGAIKPEKGIETLLAACATLPGRGWTLTVAGRGEADYVARLRARFAHLPIEWAGFVPVADYLAAIDVAVIPSLWPEPMPRTLIEALGHGLPAIVSDAGGSPEVAAKSSLARLYPRGDERALADLLRAAIAAGPVAPAPDPAFAGGFAVERLVGEYVAAYGHAIERRREAAR